MSEKAPAEHASPAAGAASALPRRLGLDRLATGLLGGVLLGALEIPDWLILVTGAPMPWLGHYFPYFAPVLAVVFVFNLAVTRRLHEGRIPLYLETLLFTAFVAMLAGVELFHGLAAGGEPRLWLVLAWFWVLVFFLVLRSFDHYLPDCRRRVVDLVIALAVVVAALDFLLAIVLAPGWGKAPQGFNAAQLFDSAYVAYLAIFAVALILFERPTTSRSGWVIQFLLLLPALALVAYLQRQSGPILLLLSLFALKALSLAIHRLRFPSLALLALAGAFLAVVLVSGADGPTLKGLGGGIYFFDELGRVHGDIISSFVRRETILGQLRLFLDAPLAGVGMARAATVKVLFLGMHSSLLYILVTAGLLGFSMFCLWWAWMLRGAVRRDGVGGVSLCMLLGGMMLLTSEPVWWWAVAFYLTSPTGNPAALSGGRTVSLSPLRSRA